MKRLFLATGAAVLGLWAGPALAQTVTETASEGEMHTEEYTYDGRRNDTYQTRFIGWIDGEAVFDETFFRSIDDPGVRAFLDGLAAPRAWAVDGAPGVLTWSAPVLTDQYEELLDVFTETSTETTVTTVVTEQWTSGDAPDAIVLTGYRGGCYDIGASGPTNYGDQSGAFANCDSWDEYVVNPGELNRNTHTTWVYTTVHSSFTNEDWLIVSSYELTGTVRRIGMVHGAVQTMMFEGASNFLREASERGDGRREDDGVRAWAHAYGGEASTAAWGPVAGSTRDTEGVQGGLDWTRGLLVFGLAFDHGETRAATVGEPEAADLVLTQAAARAGLVWPGGWFVTAVATLGRGEVESRHGDSSIGGVSTAAYDVDARGAALLAGRRIDLGGWSVTPALGYDRQWASTAAFVETGGVPLAAEDHTAERAAFWGGVGLANRFRLADGVSLDMRGRIRAYQVADGRQRSLPVVMVDLPDEALILRGAPEHANGVDYGLNLSLALGSRVSLFAAGDRIEAGDDRSTRWRAGLKLRW